MGISEERRAAIAETIGLIREIEGEQGVSRAALESIKEVLLGLAARCELFPLADFPVGEADGTGVVYRLSEDPDHRFALYASTALPGKSVPPHNHTTWATITGVHGDEHNIFYERSDDGLVAGRGTLCESGQETVSLGTGVTLMPEDIHSIYVTGEEQTLHLHMYGLALEQLHERVTYNTEAGTYRSFPASKNIRPART